MAANTIYGEVIEINCYRRLQREIRKLGGIPECVDRVFQSPHALMRLAISIGIDDEAVGSAGGTAADRPFGQVREIAWYQTLEREIRRLGGTPDCLRRVFHDERKIARLATLIIALSVKTSSPPAVRPERRLTTPS